MNFQPSIPAESLYSWESQVCQYPYTGKPGISYMLGPTEEGLVDCLLFRNEKGHVVGILNHFPWDGIWEKKGNVNIWINRRWQGKGVGEALWREAVQRFGARLEGQRFTEAGARFAERMAEKGIGI